MHESSKQGAGGSNRLRRRLIFEAKNQARGRSRPKKRLTMIFSPSKWRLGRGVTVAILRLAMETPTTTPETLRCGLYNG